MREFRSPVAALGSAGVSLLDLFVASLAGLSVAFAAFAVPSDLLGNMFGPSPDLQARLLVGGVAAGGVFGAVLLLLRWLDRLGASPLDAAESRRPRVRRRDAHPDAPPPAPLFATRDLSEPIAGPAEAARPQSAEASLQELVARLERSFVRDAPEPQAERGPEPHEVTPSAEQRLQSAIENLQRLAAGRG